MEDQVREDQHKNQGVILSSNVLLPREGHLDSAVHVMAHVGQRYNFRLVYDSSYPEINQNVFKKCDWSEFYRDAKEAIPMNIPESQSKDIDICTFVDCDHARDEESCRSRSGILMYVNITLVQWLP